MSKENMLIKYDIYIYIYKFQCVIHVHHINVGLVIIGLFRSFILGMSNSNNDSALGFIKYF